LVSCFGAFFVTRTGIHFARKRSTCVAVAVRRADSRYDNNIPSWAKCTRAELSWEEEHRPACIAAVRRSLLAAVVRLWRCRLIVGAADDEAAPPAAEQDDFADDGERDFLGR